MSDRDAWLLVAWWVAWITIIIVLALGGADVVPSSVPTYVSAADVVPTPTLTASPLCANAKRAAKVGCHEEVGSARTQCAEDRRDAIEDGAAVAEAIALERVCLDLVRLDWRACYRMELPWVRYLYCGVPPAGGLEGSR